MCGSSSRASIARVAIQGRARGLAGLLAAAALSGCGAGAWTNATRARGRRQHAGKASPVPPLLEPTAAGGLPEPVQDPATAVVDGRVLLMGGLDSADASTSLLVGAGPRGARPI